MRIRRLWKRPSPPPSSVDSSEDPSPQEEEQEVSSLQVAGNNEAPHFLPSDVPSSAVKNGCPKRSYDAFFWSCQISSAEEEQSVIHQKPMDIAGSGVKYADKDTSDFCATQTKSKISNAAVFTEHIVAPVSSDRDETPALKRKNICSDENKRKRRFRLLSKLYDETPELKRKNVCNEKRKKQRRRFRLLSEIYDETSALKRKNLCNEKRKKQRRRFRLLSKIYGNE